MLGNDLTGEDFLAIFALKLNIVTLGTNVKAAINRLTVGDAVGIWAFENSVDLLGQRQSQFFFTTS